MIETNFEEKGEGYQWRISETHDAVNKGGSMVRSSCAVVSLTLFKSSNSHSTKQVSPFF